MDYDCFAIPKGAPNRDAAMEFLSVISQAKYQANLPNHITYGPTNTDAFKVAEIDEAILKALPSHPDNAALQLPVNLEWYAEWETIAAEMYEEMLTE